MKLMHDKLCQQSKNLTAQGTNAWIIFQALDSFHETIFMICGVVKPFLPMLNFNLYYKKDRLYLSIEFGLISIRFEHGILNMDRVL